MAGRMTKGLWDKDMTDALEEMRRSWEKAAARGWPYGTYGDSLQLIEAMEDRLAKHRKAPKLLKRFALVPVILMLRGLQQMLIGYGRVYFVAFILGFLGLAFGSYVPESVRPISEVLTLYVNAFVWFTLVFAAPSTFCSAGTNAKHVETVTRKLAEWDINSKKRVELVIQNIRVFELRVNRRLLVFRWILGAAWTLYFSPQLTEVIKAWSSNGMSLMQAIVLFPPVAWLVFWFVMVEGYARGTDILFRCIELGCNERISEIEQGE